MLRVNRILISRIFIRILVSLAFCFLTLIYTGRIGDSTGFSGKLEFSAVGQRTELANYIFSFLPFYGNFTYFILFSVFAEAWFYHCSMWEFDPCVRRWNVQSSILKIIVKLNLKFTAYPLCSYSKQSVLEELIACLVNLPFGLVCENPLFCYQICCSI